MEEESFNTYNGFDTLPDELLLKIIRIAFEDLGEDNWDFVLKAPRFNFLVKVVSKISHRFKLLATDKSLWRGDVVISEEWSILEWRFLVDKCQNEGWSSFHHYRSQTHHWHTKDIETTSTKCPNLKGLMMNMDADANIMQSWPMLPTPWTSLQTLTIWRTKLGGIFEGVKLHKTLPNLVEIRVCEVREDGDTEPSFLPDLKGCDKLKLAVFLHGFFRFDGEILPGDELPLPPGLITLNLMGSRFQEEFMNRIKYEDIKKVQPGLQKFHSCQIPEHL